MEFWALIGLACLDHGFLQELLDKKRNLADVVRAYGFRLTRWEMGELRRILSIETVTHHMHEICQLAWAESFNPVDRAPCWWSAERSADLAQSHEDPYIHPLKNGRPVPKPSKG